MPSQARTIIGQTFGHAHDVVASLAKRDLLDPVDHIHLGPARVSKFGRPSMGTAGPRIIGSSDMDGAMAKFFGQLLKISKANLCIIVGIFEHLAARIADAQLARHFLGCSGHDLHQAQRADP